jgi:cysteine synthase A
MQGWSPDFVSRLTESAVDEGLVDEIIPVAGDESMQLAKDLARQEGIFVGTSAGATLAAALAVARRAEPGANIVCMLPDTAERYLSTPLFDDIGEEMDDEELALSRSTPGYRFDAPSASTPKPLQNEDPAPALDPAAEAFVSEVVRDNRVVLFALEWCEFCWSARKLFTRLGIEYESVDLDSVAYQDDDRGGKIRAVLKDRIGSPTIPQIYVGGEHIGGCTELLDEMRSGTLQQRLKACGADFDDAANFDPYELLPKWLHSRKSA